MRSRINDGIEIELQSHEARHIAKACEFADRDDLAEHFYNLEQEVKNRSEQLKNEYRERKQKVTIVQQQCSTLAQKFNRSYLENCDQSTLDELHDALNKAMGRK